MMPTPAEVLEVYRAYISKTLNAEYDAANLLVKTAGRNPYNPRLIPTVTDDRSPAVTLLSLDCQAYGENYLPWRDETTQQSILRSINILEGLRDQINSQGVNVIHLQQASQLAIEPLLQPILGPKWARMANKSGLISLYDTSAFVCQTENIAEWSSAVGPTLSLKLKSVLNKDHKIYVINHHCAHNLSPTKIEQAYRELLTLNQESNVKGRNTRSAILVHSSPDFLDAVFLGDSNKYIRRLSAGYCYLDPRTNFSAEDRLIPASAQHYQHFQRELRLVSGKNKGVKFEAYLHEKFPLEAITVRPAFKQNEQAIAIEFPENSVTLGDLKVQLGINHSSNVLIIPSTDSAKEELQQALDSLLIRNEVRALLKEQYEILRRPSILNSIDDAKNQAVVMLRKQLKRAAPGSSVADFSNIVRAWEVVHGETIAQQRGYVSADINGTQQVIADIYTRLNPVNNVRNAILRALSQECIKFNKALTAFLPFEKGEVQSHIEFVNQVIALLQEPSGTVSYQELHAILSAKIADSDFYLNGDTYGVRESPLRTFMEVQLALVAKHLQPVEDVARNEQVPAATITDGTSSTSAVIPAAAVEQEVEQTFIPPKILVSDNSLNV